MDVVKDWSVPARRQAVLPASGERRGQGRLIPSNHLMKESFRLDSGQGVPAQRE
jgi:hypothetical protein